MIKKLLYSLEQKVMENFWRQKEMSSETNNKPAKANNKRGIANL